MKRFEPAVRQNADLMRRARSAMGVGDETSAADHMLPERTVRCRWATEVDFSALFRPISHHSVKREGLAARSVLVSARIARMFGSSQEEPGEGGVLNERHEVHQRSVRGPKGRRAPHAQSRYLQGGCNKRSVGLTPLVTELRELHLRPFDQGCSARGQTSRSHRRWPLVVCYMRRRRC